MNGNYEELYGPYNPHFKLCSFCYKDQWCCYECDTPSTLEEMETDVRPVLCNACFEYENGTSDEESEESEEDEEDINYISAELVEQRMRLLRVGETLM